MDSAAYATYFSASPSLLLNSFPYILSNISLLQLINYFSTPRGKKKGQLILSLYIEALSIFKKTYSVSQQCYSTWTKKLVLIQKYIDFNSEGSFFTLKKMPLLSYNNIKKSEIYNCPPKKKDLMFASKQPHGCFMTTQRNFLQGYHQRQETYFL